DSSLRSFTYSSHQLTNAAWGPQSTTLAYDSTTGAASTVTLDSAVQKVSPALSQGLATTPAKSASQAVGVLTDALNHPSTYTLNSWGQTTQLQTADGVTLKWQRDFAGQTAVFTDGLGHATTSLFDYGSGKGDRTQVQFADGTSALFQYDATF